MPSTRDLRIMVVLTALFCALCAAVLFGGVSGDFLLLAPLLVLVVPLLGGRYVGERALRRLAKVVGRQARRPRAVSSPAPRRAPLRVVRGGLLLATAHASRPPPAARATA